MAFAAAIPAILAMVQAVKELMPLIQEMFKGSTDKYESSEKTSEDAKTLAADIQEKIPEFVEQAKKVGVDVDVSGTLDTSAEMNRLADSLEKAQASLPVEQRDSLDSIIATLRDAAEQLDKTPVSGATDDLKLTVEQKVPASQTAVYA